MARRGVSAAAGRALSEPNRENEEVSEGVRGAQEDEIVFSKAAPANSVDVVSDNGRNTHLVRCGAGEYGYVDEYRSESHGEYASGFDGGDGDDDEYEHPGEVSIGKKLWTFLAT